MCVWILCAGADGGGSHRGSRHLHPRHHHRLRRQPPRGPGGYPQQEDAEHDQHLDLQPGGIASTCFKLGFNAEICDIGHRNIELYLSLRIYLELSENILILIIPE